MSHTGHLAVGTIGEDIAATYLVGRGYRIINRNVRIGRKEHQSEIDIVAEKGNTIVFVEVKTRRQEDAFMPSDRVNTQKLRRLRSCAQIWLDRRVETQRCDISARIDVIGVCEGRVVEHYEDVST